MNPALKALNEHLRDQNTDRVERIRAKEPGVCVAPVAPTHEETIAAFESRRESRPAWQVHVPTGRFGVRYRYLSDRWRQVHRSATKDDRDRFITEYLSPMAVEIIEVWEGEP